CFDGERLAHHWRVTTESRRTPDEYGVFFTQLFATQSLRLSAIKAIVISSVVPALDHTLTEVCEKFFGIAPRFLDPGTQTVIPVQTSHPSGVGADLVAAAIGAREKYGAPLIVASYGTASVFVAISSAGAFMGAAIAPGIHISIDALVGRTAKLPQVALDKPEHAIGRDTVEALRSGLINGFVGQSEAIIARIREEMGVEARVIATGGNADVVARHSAVVSTVDPFLNLNGLRLFYQSQH
ncbi:MAG TPA: type III pantothenate kinase, partial [Candidatus Baltobacteraceae bacterium]|nr:type III pantothenate kinase [Candidatus Baltobacteraceae bacterium]